MSTDYTIEIISNGSEKLMANFTGISDIDTVRSDELGLQIYAFDESTGIQIYSFSLDFDEIVKLYQYLHQISIIRDAKPDDEIKFLEANDDLIKLINQMEKGDLNILKEILDKFDTKDKLRGLLQFLSENELNDLNASILIRKYKESLKHLKQLIEIEISDPANFLNELSNPEYGHLHEYRAGQPEGVFQNWFEKNLWVFGCDYFTKLDCRKIGISSYSDLTMITPDGFVDIIELKRPSQNIFTKDTSHNSYYISGVTSKSVGQCIHYLHELHDVRDTIEDQYKVNVVSPRAKLVVGPNGRLSSEEIKTLRKYNSNYNHITVMTYDDIVKNAEIIISYYESKVIKD